MKHNERARVAPLYLTFTHPFRTQKIHERPPAAGGGLRRPAACLRRRLRPPFATLPLDTLPLATLPPATLPFATLPACGGLRPPGAQWRRPAAPPARVDGFIAISAQPAAARRRELHTAPAGVREEHFT